MLKKAQKFKWVSTC